MNTKSGMDVVRGRWTRALVTVATAVALTGFVAVEPAAGVEATPKAIEFNTMDASATINITHNGEKVSADKIKSVKLLVEEHDYDYMIDYTKADGQLTVRPAEPLQIGSYTLAITTDYGKVTVDLAAPLNKLSSSLESRAKRQGITVDELKAQLGLSTVISEKVDPIQLPGVHYVGQTVTIPIDQTDDRTYEWLVNGKAVEIGASDAAVKYTFTEPGVYDFSYIEKRAGRPIAYGHGATNVVPEPAVLRALEADTIAKFTAPEGYVDYEWSLDGRKVADGAVFVQEFNAPGEHIVKVKAENNAPGAEKKFREVTYMVSVTEEVASN